MLTCVICQGPVKPLTVNGLVMYEGGHSASPLYEEGRCCDTCHASVVIPHRFNILEHASLKRKLIATHIKEVTPNDQ